MLNPKLLISYRAMVCKLRSLRANLAPMNAGVHVSLAKVVSPEHLQGNGNNNAKNADIYTSEEILSIFNN